MHLQKRGGEVGRERIRYAKVGYDKVCYINVNGLKREKRATSKT